MRWSWAISVILLGMVATAPATAETLVLSEGQGEYSLGPYVDTLDDPDNRWTIDDVSSPAKTAEFKPNGRNAISARQTRWLRLDVENATTQENWVLEFPFQPWNIEIYSAGRDSTQGWVVKKVGWLVPMSEREISHRWYALPLTLDEGDTSQVYVRIDSPAGIGIPVTLRDEDAFRSYAKSDYLYQGLYFGLAGVMILYTLFLYLSLRDSAYLYYVLMVGTFVLWSGLVSGLGREFLFPDTSWEYMTLLVPLNAAAALLSVRFTQSYLLTEQYTPRLHRVLWGVAGLHAVNALLQPLGGFHPGREVVFSLIIVLVFVTQMVAGVRVLRRGYRPATYYLVGFGSVLVGAVLLGLSGAGVIPGRPPITFVQVPHAIEMVLFSLGLADRINLLRREREEQEAAARDAERQASETRIQSERKSAFLASMAHELRTPMNAIKGFTNLVLRRGDELTDRNRENLKKVTHASDHLLTMINDLLDLSKIEAGRMDVNVEQFDVKAMIASACDTVSPLVQEGVELSYEVADEVGDAHTDKARVQQMVINLLSNAIKFTDTGTVTVHASVDGEGEANHLRHGFSGQGVEGSEFGSSGEASSEYRVESAELRGENQYLTISVSDTGQGIPEADLPTLFDEYRQVEGSESKVQKGTGLGLSITRKFAELLGGSIQVESVLGEGSVFTIRVPATYSDGVCPEFSVTGDAII